MSTYALHPSAVHTGVDSAFEDRCVLLARFNELKRIMACAASRMLMAAFTSAHVLAGPEPCLLWAVQSGESTARALADFGEMGPRADEAASRIDSTCKHRMQHIDAEAARRHHIDAEAAT